LKEKISLSFFILFSQHRPGVGMTLRNIFEITLHTFASFLFLSWESKLYRLKRCERHFLLCLEVLLASCCILMECKGVREKKTHTSVEFPAFLLIWPAFFGVLRGGYKGMMFAWMEHFDKWLCILSFLCNYVN